MANRKAPASENGDEAKVQRLLVALRVRPILPSEVDKGLTCIAHKIDDKTVLLVDPQSSESSDKSRNGSSQRKVVSHRYTFDWTLDERSSQEEVYRQVGKPLVENLLQGFNGAVFAYGATGAGKTYTMVGTDKSPGLMVRVFDDIFQFAKQNDATTRTSVLISYMEIYNENIRDLLNTSNNYLELREDPMGGNQVLGLSEVEVTNSSEVLRLLQKGNKRRTVEPTAANQTSSRSHALLRVSIRQSSKDVTDADTTRHRVGKLFMVDLAGSERASNTKNTGMRLKEGAHINKSLLALGNVINALATRNPKYVNFRDSKLTRLLKEALSGNCRTVMVAHISPASAHYDESRNTLVYAERARNITNKVRCNLVDVSHHVKQYQSIITELRQEIQKLQDRIEMNDSAASREPPSPSATSPDDASADNKMAANGHNDNRSTEDEEEALRHNGASDENNDGRHNHHHQHREEQRRADSAARERHLHNDKADADREIRELRAELMEAFNRQMEVRRKMMEIDNFLLALSTDLEKLSIVINQWETQKAKYEATEGEGSPEEEPGYIRQAWEDIEYIQGEQQKFLAMREDVEKEFEEAREHTYRLTENLPNVASSEEQRELLRLLTQVHKLEVEKIEMQTDQLIREHELRQRDLMIVRYDRQRLLCDEIIGKQKVLIDELSSGMRRRKARNAQATRELNELYRIYQQEIQDLSTGRDSVMKHLNVNPYRPNSVLGLRPLGSSESMWDLTHMEPLREEDDRADTQGVPLSSQSDNVAVRRHEAVRAHRDARGRGGEGEGAGARSVRSTRHGQHHGINGSRSSSSDSLSEPPHTPGGRLLSQLPPVELTNYVSHRSDIEESTRRISSLAAQRRFLRTAEHSRSEWNESTSPGTPQVRRYVGSQAGSVPSSVLANGTSSALDRRLLHPAYRRESLESLPQLQDNYHRTQRKKEQESCSIQ
ncbi:kinesin-like protein KIF19 isoform X2 [Rhipicephalus sanguineus]|uniref:kinesin-like protein KIF19 isoform X2 n=1 Tax=Rhipicephalus sanguineus TaxID=34632 RepID=UPI001893221C|nr:kinesin-like protein KIF19 isoform X2 [Rhipicephalus sanguineus]